ncbi:uncharacterized protein LOC141665749 [Apium graveolens]|uniref:uncharacterized protein LOC141665749 n=1 Tax=Apium graveolens TaxID=4045 RepID=UPI003D7AE71E
MKQASLLWNNLIKQQQTGSIEEYIDEFENLRSLMEEFNHVLPDTYLLESFIGGLKSTLKPFVKAFKPSTVSESIIYARLQEESILANTQKIPKMTYSSSVQKSFSPSIFNSNVNKPPLLPTPQSKPIQTSGFKSNNKPFRFISADVRAEKIAKGLCYYCDEKYERGHKCQFKESQLFTVEIPGEVSVCVEVDSELDDVVFDISEPCISVNALAESQTFSTTRVKGMVTNGIMTKQALHILIDSGSTHNFLNIHLASSLGCKIEKIQDQQVTVADGNHLVCQHVVKNFCWKLNGHEFSANVLLIDLGSCDMVLGVQWLSTLGTVRWDFKNLIMEFMLAGNLFKLRGISPKKLKVLKGDYSSKLFKNAAQLCFVQINEISSLDDESSKDSINVGVQGKSVETINADQGPISDLSKLKEQDVDIFREPDALPPTRGIFDHRILLQEWANPVNIRPYRYPLKQRDVIEQLIEEMLERGIIRNSASPFASPVVLVGKKDGTWRLCVDYRDLNMKTVKDRYRIPVVDEFIDELAWATIFSKIDLRAGYHQLRVHDEDIFKTTFKTHSGHYEFLMMPFGLTNAPASFQGWMNSIFKPLLRKSVLVFFYDILIYSKSVSAHCHHLSLVFGLMRQHSLFAKESKCCFMMEKIEYLGHFISAMGVETVPRKVESVVMD